MPETAGMHHYIGLMSGTSVDGIDAALVSIDDHNKISLLATHQHAIPDELRRAIQALMQPGDNELDREGMLDMQLGELFAEAATALLQKSSMQVAQVRAIGSHGQTVRHRPHAEHPFTRQIGNPSVIAERTGITTVADFRTRDIAAGGQGAPLVPAFHNAMFSTPGTARAIVNIGGIANLTWLPALASENVTGFDTGPGNTLLDYWAQQHLKQPFDRHGAWAAQGMVLDDLLKQLLNEPYFQLPAPKSTGRELFNAMWLNTKLTGKEPAADVQATLSELTARSIASSLPTQNGEVFLCGGGAHNHDLIQRLQRQLPAMKIATTAGLGIDPDWVEAMAFAWLAHQTLAGKSGNLPTVTGARHPVVLGGIYLA